MRRCRVPEAPVINSAGFDGGGREFLTQLNLNFSVSFFWGFVSSRFSSSQSGLEVVFRCKWTSNPELIRDYTELGQFCVNSGLEIG